MSSLKLYYARGSPPSRSCMMLAKALDLNAEIVELNLGAGEQNKPEFLKLNKRHQVPVLVDGDFVLTESRAILAYMVNKFKPGDLYPTDPKQRAIVDERLYFDATVLFETGANIIRAVLYNQIKKVSDDMKKSLHEALGTLEDFLTNFKWMAGDQVTIADYSMLGSLTTLKELNVDFSKYPKLNDWYDRCKSFAGFEDNVAGAKFLADRMFSILEDKSL